MKELYQKFGAEPGHQQELGNIAKAGTGRKILRTIAVTIILLGRI